MLTALPGSVNSTHEPIPEVCGPAGLCVVHIHTRTHSIRNQPGTCVQIMAFPQISSHYNFRLLSTLSIDNSREKIKGCTLKMYDAETTQARGLF